VIYIVKLYGEKVAKIMQIEWTQLFIIVMIEELRIPRIFPYCLDLRLLPQSNSVS